MRKRIGQQILKYICICTALALVACAKGESYNISHEGDRYILSFYAEDNELIFSKKSLGEPTVTSVGKGVYKTVYSTGTNANYTYFIDVEQKNVSDAYFNLLFHNENMAVFMNDGLLMVTDLFDKEQVRAQITRDFAPTAVPEAAITSAEIKENILYVDYLKGTQMEETHMEIRLTYEK